MTKRIVSLILAAAFLPSSLFAANDDDKFDSAHTVMLDATVTDGILLTKSPKENHKSEIRSQLRYLVGQLNYWNGAPQLAKFQISLGESQLQPNGFTQVHYAAQGSVAWSRRYVAPATFEAILPARGDAFGIQKFFNLHSPTCAETSGISTLNNFWYHYRPLYESCALSEATPAESGVVQRTQMKFGLSRANTSGKSPEYGEVWKDGKLVVTVVMSKYKSGATDSDDAGITAFNELYEQLNIRYGEPATINARFEGSPGAQHPELRMTFAIAHGTLDITVFLVNQLSAAGPTFIQKYAARTLISDAVIYDGHAGLGENVRALSRIGKYAKGMYQVFMINGCDTFAYVDDALFKAHGAVNPGSLPTKHLEVLSNAMPAFFSSMSDVTMSMITALDEQRKTYRQIMAEFDSSQSALVAGEEDNVWVRPAR